MTRTGMLLALLVAAALLAACDEADDADPAEDLDDDAVAEEDLEEEDPDEDADLDEEAAEGDAADEDDAEDADAAVTVDPDVALRIEYEADLDEADGLQSMTVAQDGAERFAWWATTPTEEVVTMMDEEGATSCVAEDEAWQCFQVPDLEAAEEMGTALPGFIDEGLVVEDAAEAGFVDLSEDVIAGRDAVCGEPEEDLGEQAADRVCVDTESGALLLAEGPDFRLEAVDVDEPTDEDFEPPAEPQDLGM